MAGTRTSRLIAELLDRVSAPAKAISRSLHGVTQAANGLSAAGRGMTAFSLQMERAARLNTVALNTMRGKMLDAVAATYTLKQAFGGTAGIAADFESTMLDIAQKADLPDAAMKALGERVKKLAPTINRSAGEVAKSMDTLMGMGLDQKKAEAALGPIGRVATAYRAELEEVSKAAFSVIDNLKVDPSRLTAALDAMSQAGKEGAFELKDMAREFPALTASAQALGMTGVEAVAKLSAALQIARKGAGTSSEAATNTANLMQKIVSPATTKKFEKVGINIRKELKKTQQTGGDVFEMIARLVQKATKGDLSKIGDFFEDAQVQQFLRPLIQNLAEYRRIRDAAKGADGVVDKDFIRRMQTAEAQTKALKDGLNTLGLSIGSILLPSLNDLTQKALAVTNQFSAFAETHPELVGGAIKVAVSLVALKVATTATAYAYRVLRGSALSAMAVVAAGKARAAMAAAGLVALLSPIKLVTAGFRAMRLAILSTGVGAVVVGLGTAVAFLSQNWEGLKKAVSGFGEAFMAALGPEARANLKPFTDAVSGIAGFFEQITGKIDEAKWEEWGKTAGQAAAGLLGDMRQIAASVNAIAAGLGKVTEWFSGSGNLLANTMREFKALLELYERLIGVRPNNREGAALNPSDELPGVSAEEDRRQPQPQLPAAQPQPPARADEPRGSDRPNLRGAVSLNPSDELPGVSADEDRSRSRPKPIAPVAPPEPQTREDHETEAKKAAAAASEKTAKAQKEVEKTTKDVGTESVQTGGFLDKLRNVIERLGRSADSATIQLQSLQGGGFGGGASIVRAAYGSGGFGGGGGGGAGYGGGGGDGAPRRGGTILPPGRFGIPVPGGRGYGGGGGGSGGGSGGGGSGGGSSGNRPPFDGDASRFGNSGGGTVPGSSAGNLTGVIDQAAREAGIDPRIMQGIRAGESGRRGDYDVKSDAVEDSYGPFQLNRRGGLGQVFEKETGLNLKDPKTIPEQARWVARHLAKKFRQNPNYNPGSEWYGYRGPRDADPKWGDSGYKPDASATAENGASVPPRDGVGGVDQRQSSAKHRRQPITPELRDQLAYAGAQAGVNAEVYSGGQDAHGPNRTGSHRHDHGRSADVRLYTMENGRKRYLRSSSPADRERMAAFMRAGAQAGVTGIGHGPDYMGTDGIHMGGGSELAWGAGGRSGNAPQWVRDAHRRGVEARRRSPVDANAWQKGRSETASPDPKAPVAPRIVKPAPGSGMQEAYNGLRSPLDSLNGTRISPTGDPSGIHAIRDAAYEAKAALRDLQREHGRVASRNHGGGARTGKVMTAMRGGFFSQGIG